MPLAALGLVVVAACLHATWNLAAKRAKGATARFVWLYGVVTVVTYAPLAAWTGWTERPSWGVAEWAYVAASAAIHVVYSIVLQRGYEAADLTVVYPVARGVGPLLTALGAVLLLGERPSAIGVAGITLVVTGVLVIARVWTLFRAGGSSVATGVRWGVATGVLVASYTLVDGRAVKIALLSPLLLDYATNCVRLVFLSPGALRDRAGLAAEAKAFWRPALVIGTIAPLGYILVLTAMRMAPVSYVAPARELSLLVGAVLGATVLREGDVPVRLSGAALIAAGVVLIGIG